MSKKTIFLIFFLSFVLLFLSSCSTPDPLNSSIQGILDNYKIKPNIDNGKAEVQLVKETNNNNNNPGNPSEGCVDNDPSDDVCSYGGCGPDFSGNTVKCEFCTDSCGNTYGTGNCEPCGVSASGTCSCASNDYGGSYVDVDKCNPGYVASCKSDGSCVCASEEE